MKSSNTMPRLTCSTTGEACEGHQQRRKPNEYDMGAASGNRQPSTIRVTPTDRTWVLYEGSFEPCDFNAIAAKPSCEPNRPKRKRLERELDAEPGLTRPGTLKKRAGNAGSDYELTRRLSVEQVVVAFGSQRSSRRVTWDSTSTSPSWSDEHSGRSSQVSSRSVSSLPQLPATRQSPAMAQHTSQESAFVSRDDSATSAASSVEAVRPSPSFEELSTLSRQQLLAFLQQCTLKRGTDCHHLDYFDLYAAKAGQDDEDSSTAARSCSPITPRVIDPAKMSSQRPQAATNTIMGAGHAPSSALLRRRRCSTAAKGRWDACSVVSSVRVLEYPRSGAPS